MAHRNLIYPIFLPMQGCSRRCIYCDQEKISASGALDIDSEVANAARFVANHPRETKEIAFYGGSFTALSSAYRSKLMARFHQIIDSTTSFRISTHPLHIDQQILVECKLQGITCIELGIQDFASEVLRKSQRGYSGEQAIQAAKLVHQHGFKLGVQLLPGLPGSNAASIQENTRCLSALKPDYLRIYPLILIKGTALTASYERGEYLPLSLDEAVHICADYAEVADREGITIIKLGLPSTLAPQDVVAGPYHPAFGEFVLAERLIRHIIGSLENGEQIKLDKKQRTLILAHKGKFKLSLQKRLENCSIDEQNLAPLL